MNSTPQPASTDANLGWQRGELDIGALRRRNNMQLSLSTKDKKYAICCLVFVIAIIMAASGLFYIKYGKEIKEPVLPSPLPKEKTFGDTIKDLTAPESSPEPLPDGVVNSLTAPAPKPSSKEITGGDTQNSSEEVIKNLTAPSLN